MATRDALTQAADLYDRSARAFRVGDRKLGVSLRDEAKKLTDSEIPMSEILVELGISRADFDKLSPAEQARRKAKAIAEIERDPSFPNARVGNSIPRFGHDASPPDQALIDIMKASGWSSTGADNRTWRKDGSVPFGNMQGSIHLRGGSEWLGSSECTCGSSGNFSLKQFIRNVTS